MSDIVERLRSWARPAGTNVDLPLYSEAADEIERLRNFERGALQQIEDMEAENEQLRAENEQLRKRLGHASKIGQWKAAP